MEFSSTLYRNSWFRILYLIVILISLLVFRLPYWMVTAIPRNSRPRRAWSFGKTVRLKLIRFFFALGHRVGPLSRTYDHMLLPEKLQRHIIGVWIPPLDTSLIQGELAVFVRHTKVKPARIPGYWTHRKTDLLLGASPPLPNEKVVLMLHGGGYIGQSAHPSDPTQGITRGLLKWVPSVKRVFSVEYRLSKGMPFHAPRHPFPTALLDGLSGYSYLLNEVGFNPENVIIMGDSAGANIALALTRYLKSVSLPSLKPPAALLLPSPWCDLGFSHISPTSSLVVNRRSDYLGDEISLAQIHYAILSFLGPFPYDMISNNPYISPASLGIPEDKVAGLFKGFPPTMIISGSAEQFLDQIRTLYARMEGDMRNKVRYIEMEDAFHDFLCFNFAEPERSSAFEAINEWICQL